VHDDRLTRVICHQLGPEVGHLSDNVAMAERAIVDALSAGADLIVLPELVTSGYVFRSAEEVRALAITRDDPLFLAWQRLLGDSTAVLVFGFAELAGDGLVYNSAAVLDRHGVRAVYQKNHLWDEEKRWFTPGRHEPPVIDTPLGRVGVLICYDLEFPETSRDLALRGAELLAVPTNWPATAAPPGERPAEMANAMVAARVNRVFIACCDRVRTERGVAWTGGSCVVGPDGWVIADIPTRDAGVVVGDIDVSLARDKSLNDHNDVFGDRRPELYGSLLRDQ
jgi:5-aminopentanamidase